MLVSTDHIRWYNNGENMSAIEERNLCDKIPLFKLGIGKSIKIIMKKKKILPKNDDKYRTAIVSFSS